MAAGLIDANLGGGLIKKRIAQPGRGKRGSTRVLVAANFADRWVFISGFEKHEKDNLSRRELTALQHYAAELLSLSTKQLNDAIGERILLEVLHEQTKN